MSTFTIDSDNNIAAHAGSAVTTDDLPSFASEKELAKLTVEWPASRLVETWNSFAGVNALRRPEAGQEVHQPPGCGSSDLAGGPASIPGRCAQGGRRRAQQGPVEEVLGQGQTARHGAEGHDRRTHQQEGRGHCHDEARQRSNARSDHGSDGLAKAHSARLREDPGQPGRGEGGVHEERRRGAHLSHCEVARPPRPSNAASGSNRGGVPTFVTGHVATTRALRLGRCTRREASPPGAPALHRAAQSPSLSDVTDRSRHGRAGLAANIWAAEMLSGWEPTKTATVGAQTPSGAPGGAI